MDYRKFLAKEETLVLPFFGGTTVDAPDRRVRVATPPTEPGWYELTLRGRQVTLKGKAAAPDLSALPTVRGHFWNGNVVTDGALVQPLELLPEEEPPRFSPVTARRWHGGRELIFDTVEFESEAEEAAREQLSKEEALAGIKGVPATLRAAFGYAFVEAVSRSLRIEASWGEVRGFVAQVADGGRVAAEAGLRALHAERLQTRAELMEQERRRAAQAVRAAVETERRRRMERARDAAAEVETRASEALEAAGARVSGVRNLGNDRVEVSFRFMGERFTVIAISGSFQVLDSGICLGHPPRDDLVTLDSLPSVIKEAIEEHKLVRLR